MKLSRILRPDPEKPSLRERAADLKAGLARVVRRHAPQEADQGRRAVMGGALAAAVPLPALAAPPAEPSTQPHPDQALLDLDAARAVAWTTLEAAETASRLARQTVNRALAARPIELEPHREEYLTLTHPSARSGWGQVRFRWVPLDDDGEAFRQWRSFAWTGAGLRHAIARAPSAQGRAGRTPFQIRRWRGLLPIADAFDERVTAAEVAADYHRLRQERDAATEVHRALAAAIEASVATTPEGMAALIRVIAPTPWKDVWGAWPNLLRSAANVASIDPASLEHEYASTRGRSA